MHSAKFTWVVVQTRKVFQKLASSLHVPGHTHTHTHTHVTVSVLQATHYTLCAACHSPDEQFLVRLVHSHLLWHVLGQQFVAVANREVRQFLKPDRTFLPESRALWIHPSYVHEGSDKLYISSSSSSSSVQCAWHYSWSTRVTADISNYLPSLHYHSMLNLLAESNVPSGHHCSMKREHQPTWR